MSWAKKQILSLSPRSKNHPFYQYLFDLIDHLGIKNYECYYFYVCPWGSGTDYLELSNIDYRADHIIFYAEDNLVGKTPHIYYKDARPYGLVEIEKICLKHPDKKFVLVNILYDLQKLVSVKNLRCVGLLPIGQVNRKTISEIKPCLDKKHTYGKNWICFNHTPSHSRICLLSYLLYKKLDLNGKFTISDVLIEECQSYEDPSEFTHYMLGTALKKQLKKGFQRLKNKEFDIVDIDPYNEEDQNDDLSNYQHIYKAYETSRLEIVTSSLYSEPTPQVSEKEIQSIYGCNFLLIIGNPNLVNLLRKWGFDVFDDVVDHSYDRIISPYWRMFKAIDDNIKLLDGTVDLDSLWKENRSRFIENCQVVNRLHEVIEKDFVKDLVFSLEQLDITHTDIR